MISPSIKCLSGNQEVSLLIQPRHWFSLFSLWTLASLSIFEVEVITLTFRAAKEAAMALHTMAVFAVH